MATEAEEPPPKFSSSEEEGGGGGEEEVVEKGKVGKIEEDGEQQPPWKSEGPEAVRGGGKSRRPVVFTKDQLCEVQRQLAVLSYVRARLPVPPVLLLHTPVYVHSSNSPLARSGHRSSNCCSKIEPEPGRCRRTDGKRWRCKNGVIPNTKYCERHIHRGCNRSRKLVEGFVYNPTISPPMTSQPAQQASSYETPPLLRPLPPSNSTKNLENLCDVGCNLTSSMSLVGDIAPEAPPISSNSADTKVTCAVSTTASEDARPHSSDSTSHDTAGIMVGLGTNPTHNLVRAAIGCLKREILTEKDDFNHTAIPVDAQVDAAYSSGIGKEHTIVTASSKVQSTSVASTPSDVSGRKIMAKDEDFPPSANAASTIAISMVAKSDSGDTRSHGSDNSQSIGQDSATKRRIRIRVIDKIITSQGFTFSPKSVLQGANDHHPHPNPPIQGCSPLCFNKSDPEEQLWRCRRTDGRKWRCGRDVIPNEKYCAMHMHRGAKRQVQNPQPTDLPSSKRSRATHPHLHPSLPSKEKYTRLNHDLSISALEFSRPIEDDEPSTTGNSSDATIYSSNATIYSSDATISDDNTSYEN